MVPTPARAMHLELKASKVPEGGSSSCNFSSNIYIYYTPRNLGFPIAVLGREREQGRFRGSSKEARGRSKGALREHGGASREHGRAPREQETQRASVVLGEAEHAGGLIWLSLPGFGCVGVVLNTRGPPVVTWRCDGAQP